MRFQTGKLPIEKQIEERGMIVCKGVRREVLWSKEASLLPAMERVDLG